MAINPNQALAQDLAKKLKLERRLAATLRPYFNHLAEDIGAAYASTGSAVIRQTSQLRLASILESHYRDVFDAFKRSFRNRATKGFDLFEAKQDEEVDRFLLGVMGVEFIRLAEQESALIADTTQTELDAIVQEVRATPRDRGVRPPTREEQAGEIERRFAERNANRIQTIAETETQLAAESVKLGEIDTLIATEAVVADVRVTPSSVGKSWETTLDNRTRPSHVDVDGQRRSLNEPFTVGGASLQYPGDRSLGAPAKETINCRCAAIYDFK